MAVVGCRIKKVNGGFAVKNTVFEKDYNAQLYAYYLRIVLNNGLKVRYVKDVDEAIDLIFKKEKRTDVNGSQRQWLQACWKRNENKYLHVASGMYAVDNLNDKE